MPSPQINQLRLKTVSHKAIFDARPAVTFPAAGRHRSLAGKARELHACEQLAQGYYLKAKRPGVAIESDDTALHHTDYTGVIVISYSIVCPYQNTVKML